MTAFVAAASRPDIRVLPIRVGPNTFGCDELIRLALRTRGIRTPFLDVPAGSACIEHLMCEDTEAIVFQRGQSIPIEFQDDWCRGVYPKIQLIIALTDIDPRALVPKDVASTSRFMRWQKTFYDAASPQITWPAWNTRPSDHGPLIRGMARRVAKKYEHDFAIHPQVFAALRDKSYVGTDTVLAALERACLTHRSNDVKGPILPAHLKRAVGVC